MSDYLSVTTIKISGVGLLVSYEGELIKRALESAGFVVEMNDPHPPENVDDWMERRVVRQKQKQHTEGKVILHIHHQPWGG